MRRTAQEPLFNSLMEEHRYLGYEQPVSEHLKYLAWAAGRPIACLAWSSAPRHIGSRDRYIVNSSSLEGATIVPRWKLQRQETSTAFAYDGDSSSSRRK